MYTVTIVGAGGEGKTSYLDVLEKYKKHGEIYSIPTKIGLIDVRIKISNNPHIINLRPHGIIAMFSPITFQHFFKFGFFVCRSI